MQNSGLPFAPAVNYRVKAQLLRQMAAFEVSETLRSQLTDLALQYEQLAGNLEGKNSPDRQNLD